MTSSGLSVSNSSAVPRTRARSRYGLARLVVGGDFGIDRRGELAIALLERERGAGQPGEALDPFAVGLAQRVERGRRGRHLVGANVLQRDGQLLGPGLGLLLLAVLPVEIAGDGEQEQDDGADDQAAIALGALGHLVAAEVLVDLANEAFGSIIWGKRQIIPLMSSGQCQPSRLHSPPRMNKSWRRRSSAQDAKGKEGADGRSGRHGSRFACR